MTPLVPLLTVPDVAEILGVSRYTVYRLASTGSLRSVNVGAQIRFEEEAVRAYVARQTTEAA